jgi:hypothetical protein
VIAHDESLQTVLEEANRLTEGVWRVGPGNRRILGATHSSAHRFKEYDRGGDHYFEWSIVCTLKRPQPPGSTEVAAAVAIKSENPDPDGNLVGK